MTWTSTCTSLGHVKDDEPTRNQIRQGQDTMVVPAVPTTRADSAVGSTAMADAKNRRVDHDNDDDDDHDRKAALLVALLAFDLPDRRPDEWNAPITRRQRFPLGVQDPWSAPPLACQLKQGIHQTDDDDSDDGETNVDQDSNGQKKQQQEEPNGEFSTHHHRDRHKYTTTSKTAEDPSLTVEAPWKTSLQENHDQDEEDNWEEKNSIITTM
jgi:hypothetical protein